MSSFNLSGVGLGSGINWSEIVQHELKSHKKRHVEPLEERAENVETEFSALGELKGELDELQKITGEMKTPSDMSSMLADSSDTSVLEATAGAEATPGTHSVEVNQLADNEVMTHEGLEDSTTVVNNTDDARQFAYSYGETDVTMQVEPGTTLEELTELINNHPDNPGISASIMDDGSGGSGSHHLVLRGNDTGESYDIQIDDADTTLGGEWANLTADAAEGTSTLEVDDTADFTQHQAVMVNDENSGPEYHVVDSVNADSITLQDSLGDGYSADAGAYVTPRGVSSGASGEATSGSTEIEVADASGFEAGKNILIADGEGSEERVISDVDTTNNVITVESELEASYTEDAGVTQLEEGRDFDFAGSSFDETKTAQNAQIKLDNHPSDGWIERENNSISDVLDGVTLDLKEASPGEKVSVSISEDSEAIKEKVHEFVEQYNAVRTYINESTGYDTEEEEGGELMGSSAVRAVETHLQELITSPPPGFDRSEDSYSLLGQIGIESVGDATDEEQLGTLEVDDAALDSAIADDPDGVVSLLSENFDGASDNSNLRFYQASSALTTAGEYDVEADYDTEGDLTDARIKLTDEEEWREATVEDNYIKGQSDNPEEALWIASEWDGESSTQSAEVRVQQGVANAMDDRLEAQLDSRDGMLVHHEEGYGDRLSNLEDQIETEQDRMTELEERLTEKYARLESRLSELKNEQEGVGGMTGNLFSQQA
ncbi:MAG: flagellar filament capping protein FliD [Candidatus Brocadiia bacterium]